MKTEFSRKVYFLFLSLLSTATWVRGAQMYDPATSFSVTKNPNGVWSYGFSSTLGGPLILHESTNIFSGINFWLTPLPNSSQAPSVFHNPTAAPASVLTLTLAPGELALHPGPEGQFAVLRFTAPSAGPYYFVGSYSGRDHVGTSTDAYVLADGLPLLSGTVNGYGEGTGFSFDTTATLTAGGTLDFAVGFGANRDFHYDTTALSLEIFSVPEPSSYWFLLAGLLAMGCRWPAKPNVIVEETSRAEIAPASRHRLLPQDARHLADCPTSS
ncbi:MAG: hypothetical protein HY043_07220 [Verrucomicrobia bacterium]|nr:hypothetical protein [Verrucomicrobiota bacterium]